jgi:hypothetical protein
MAALVVRRIYVYAAAFLGLQLLAAGAGGLIAQLLEQLLEPALGRPAEDVFRLSLNVALLVVGLALWAIHWFWAQREARRTEEQHSALRRLYGYLVLLIAMLSMLVAARELLDTLFSGAAADMQGSEVAAALGNLVVAALLWGYHWRVFSADRAAVEQAGATATLRRWYLVLVQAASLGLASFGAVDLLHLLLQLGLTAPIGNTPGVGSSAAGLLAGLVAWLPHHLWGRRLIGAPTPLRADEARSTLRQVYTALVVTAAAVAALGGLAGLLYELLLAALGGAPWSSLLVEQTQALAVVLIAVPLWLYHRRQLAYEARLSGLAARGATARRVIGYLTAAVGLGALFFGLGGLVSTLLRLWLAPNALGGGWREPLSFWLALAAVALPVYAGAALGLERLARSSSTEERTLARRIYLYAALLFGIIAAISAAVALLRLALQALLGAAEPDLAAELGRWLGYLLIGAAIAAYHATLLRRAGAARGDMGAGTSIAIIADEPLREALRAALAREAPGATLRVASTDAPDSALAALDAAAILVAALPAAFDGPLAPAIRAFGGRRLLLASDLPGYELIGAQRGEEAIARAAARALRALLNAAPQVPAPAERTPSD